MCVSILFLTQVVYLLASLSSMILVKSQKKYQVIPNYSKSYTNTGKYALVRNAITEKLILRFLSSYKLSFISMCMCIDFVYIHIYILIFDDPVTFAFRSFGYDSVSVKKIFCLHFTVGILKISYVR